MPKMRLDQALATRGLCQSRNQAESYIRLGLVKVDGKTVNNANRMVDDTNNVQLLGDQYVSRAGLKLASVADRFKLNFRGKIVLDVGSSTGGFTDFALQNGASKVIAVDVGTNQLHPKLREDNRVELHEQTDIRNFVTSSTVHKIDIVVIDVSFISLRQILPAVGSLCSAKTRIIAMCKPQFEADQSSKHKGVIKNDQMRRTILKEFENWAKKYFVVEDKADSAVAGNNGNQERFYLVKPLMLHSKHVFS